MTLRRLVTKCALAELVLCESLCFVFSFASSKINRLAFSSVVQVENWCPRLPWRTKTLNEEIDRRGQVRKHSKQLPLTVNHKTQ